MKKMLFSLFALVIALALLAGCTGTPINEGITKEGLSYKGAANAKLTIYEYSDFECPFCGRAQPTVEEVLRAYPDSVRIVFKHYPLPIHPRAVPSAYAAICAEKQGKFWAMHDKLYANNGALEDADLKKYAGEIGLDIGAFDACLSSPKTDARMRADMAEAVSEGVVATPTFVMGGTSVQGAQPFSKFKQAIDGELSRLG